MWLKYKADQLINLDNVTSITNWQDNKLVIELTSGDPITLEVHNANTALHNIRQRIVASTNVLDL